MTDERQPLRSLEDPSTPEALRRALSAHAADRPSPELLARMAKNLRHAVAAPAAASSASSPLMAAKAASWLGVGAAVVASAALWLKLPMPAAPREPAPVVAPSRPAAARPAVAAPAPATTPAPRAPEPPAVPRASAPPARSRKAEPRAEHPNPSAEPLPAAADPAAELQLLQRAQQQLAAAPARSLALVAEHAARYPDGVFSQERELIAVVALLRRGQLHEAEQRAEHFRRTFPDSVHLSRLEAVLRDQNNSSFTTPMIERGTK